MIPLLLVLAFAADAKEEKGWLSLFDGETTFGWKIEGQAKIEKGKLILGGGKATTATVTSRFAGCRLVLNARYDVGCMLETDEMPAMLVETATAGIGAGHVPFRILVPAGKRAVVESARVLPRGMTPLFDGKTLAGWKVFKGDPKRMKSTFTARDGVLSMKSGPGDLASEKLLDDFVLQLECKTNGKHLNSGVFFRAIPGQYQNGYECQIQNDFSLAPPRKYLVDVHDPETHKKTGTRSMVSAARDFGTGAIYRRVPARRAVARDGEWFTLTIVARGRHLASWVNGVQQVDWTDERPADDNPRKGYRSGAGAISLQGHDPSTDLSFRAIRYAAIPRKP